MYVTVCYRPLFALWVHLDVIISVTVFYLKKKKEILIIIIIIKV